MERMQGLRCYASSAFSLAGQKSADNTAGPGATLPLEVCEFYSEFHH